MSSHGVKKASCALFEEEKKNERKKLTDIVIDMLYTSTFYLH